MKFLTITAVVLILSGSAFLHSDENFAGINPREYVTGQFNYAKNPHFTTCASAGIDSGQRTIYLRRETASALKRMIADFHREHPEVPVTVLSGTRSYHDQNYIWNAKFSGRVPVEGAYLDRTLPDPRRRGLAILRYSSMPGTSRHHWGTDVDLNSLDNRYFSSGGGAKLYAWLVRNAPSHGFCQPYIAGRSEGYLEEKWHWSYLPLSSRFLRTWNELHESGDISPANFSFGGAAACGDLASRYVNGINGSCR